MNPIVIIILATLLVGLLICLAPFITLLLVLYGLSELIKHYVPSKVQKKASKPKEMSKTNTFKIDFLRQ